MFRQRKTSAGSARPELNRYTDIIPYDATRVVLGTSSTSEDYINASHIRVMNLLFLSKFLNLEGNELQAVFTVCNNCFLVSCLIPSHLSFLNFLHLLCLVRQFTGQSIGVAPRRSTLYCRARPSSSFRSSLLENGCTGDL